MSWQFADTNYYLALLGPRDQHHVVAVAWSQRENLRIVTSEFILIELGNFLTRGHDRTVFVDLNRTIRADPNTELVPISADLFARALDLFERRPDKTWSFSDCTSFVIMLDRNLTEALTADQHFVQAGYRALLLETPDSA
jgi:predicted nucleic acid-binding protein